MFTLPHLSYDYDTLEPHFDAETMRIHHTKHHQTYIDKANAALTGTLWEGKNAREILTHLGEIPAEIQMTVQNNVGGHWNHSFFWEILSPTPQTTPSGKLLEAIETSFGDVENFQKKFGEAATARFGSGWAWLIKKNNALEIISTANQDSPISRGLEPIFGLDVWEHAYYLQYQNRRPDYIAAFWNVLDWKKAAENFESQKSQNG